MRLLIRLRPAGGVYHRAGLRPDPLDGRASPVYLPPMTDRHHQHHEAIVLDRGDDTIVPDAVAPKPLAVAGVLASLTRLGHVTTRDGKTFTIRRAA